MFISFEAAIRAVDWEFRDSGTFSAWMNTRPWRSVGGVRLLRLPDPSVLFPFCHSVERLAFASELGDQGLKLFTPEEGDDPFESLSRSLMQSLCGEPRDLSRFELRKRLIEELNRWPILFVVLPDPVYSLCMIEEARILSEELQKDRSPTVYPLTILFLESAGANSGETDFFDFSVGFPRRRLFESTEFEAELWSTYLYLRAAWESAGNPAVAARIITGVSCIIGVPVRQNRLMVRRTCCWGAGARGYDWAAE
jgi:hypothetical protein